jgi:HD-GYP domain-containing protein (c-di-GMP phosphodiesterase class II)
VSKALEIMTRDVGSAIDAACFAALRGALRKLDEAAAAAA